MKKLIALALALILTLSCASAMAELIFTTGGTSGTYYAFGNVLAQYITNNSDVAVTAVSGNGSAANIDLLDLGDAQLALVQNDVANYAYNGIRFEQYEGNPSTPSPPCARCTPRPCSWSPATPTSSPWRT